MSLSNKQNTNGTLAEQPKKRRTNKSRMVRITLSIPDGLLDMVDEAAEKDFTTRSDMIRIALLWYLRPQGRDLDQVDPEEILKTLRHRRARAAMKEMIRDAETLND